MASYMLPEVSQHHTGTTTECYMMLLKQYRIPSKQKTSSSLNVQSNRVIEYIFQHKEYRGAFPSEQIRYSYNGQTN